jgi:hypothetical protein
MTIVWAFRFAPSSISFSSSSSFREVIFSIAPKNKNEGENLSCESSRMDIFSSDVICDRRESLEVNDWERKEKKRRKKRDRLLLLGLKCRPERREREREGKQNNGDSAQYKNGVVSNHTKK